MTLLLLKISNSCLKIWILLFSLIREINHSLTNGKHKIDNFVSHNAFLSYRQKKTLFSGVQQGNFLRGVGLKQDKHHRWASGVSLQPPDANGVCERSPQLSGVLLQISGGLVAEPLEAGINKHSFCCFVIFIYLFFCFLRLSLDR